MNNIAHPDFTAVPNHVAKDLIGLIGACKQAEVPIEHFFSEGMYGRMMTLEPNTYLVGKTHKHAHLAMLVEGRVEVISKRGAAIYHAPYVVNVEAGDQRAFRSLTKVKWITVHATIETDLDQLELQLVEG